MLGQYKNHGTRLHFLFGLWRLGGAFFHGSTLTKIFMKKVYVISHEINNWEKLSSLWPLVIAITESNTILPEFPGVDRGTSSSVTYQTNICFFTYSLF